MDFENIETRLGLDWNTEGVGIDFDTTLNILQSVQSNIIDEVAWLVEGMHPKSLPDTYSESDDCISRQQVIDLLQVVKIDLQSKPNAPHYQKIDNKPMWVGYKDGVHFEEPYTHQDEMYSNTCTYPTYCRCSQ